MGTISRRLTSPVLCLTLLCQSGAYADEKIEVAFAPSPDAINLLLETINSAGETINLADYTFSSKKIAEALIEARRRGVVVRVVLDKASAEHAYPAIANLTDAGIEVRFDYKYQIMHDKFIVVDSQTVETGSFNYTSQAEHRNAENVIVIHDDKNLASKFLSNWQKLWDESSPQWHTSTSAN